MKKQIIIKKLALSTALSLLALGQANQLSFASGVNYSSAFYKSNKTRQAYVNLSPERRAELDRMNTDGKAPLTLDEVVASGNYNLPIVKGQDWLYPFMIDKDKDGQVGEKYFKINGKSQTKTNTNNQAVSQPVLPIADLEPEEEIEEAPVSETDKTDELDAVEFEEEALESQEDKKEKLRLAVERAKREISAAEYILENYPKTVAHVKDQLIDLIAHSKDLLRIAELALVNN